MKKSSRRRKYIVLRISMLIIFFKSFIGITLFVSFMFQGNVDASVLMLGGF